jgi:cytochrome c peroxidase
MRRKCLLFLFFTCLVFLSFTLTKDPEGRAVRINLALNTFLVKNAASLVNKLADLKKNCNENELEGKSLAEIKKLFIDCRLLYKKTEAFSAYYFPASGQDLNGPVVSEIEVEDELPLQIEYPHGFQVIEAILWSIDVKEKKKELITEAEHLLKNYTSLSNSFPTVPTNEVQFFEAIQSHVIRTFTLGIAQFDASMSGSGLEETRITLEAMLEAITFAYSKELSNPYLQQVTLTLKNAISFFQKTKSFDQMDFLSCLHDVYQPLSSALANARKDFVQGNYYPPSGIRFDKPTIFSASGFNTFFYNPRGIDFNYPDDVSLLGQALFFDPVMSSNNKRACASCHKPGLAFTDKEKTSGGFHIGEKLSRNAPTLINVGLQRNYFYDSRAYDLEDQIRHVLTNEKEMMSSYDEVVLKLEKSKEYKEWFTRAFSGSPDTVISEHSIANAIAEYERKLVSLESRFDKNVRGELSDFTTEEKKGFNVYMNNARCGTCHYLPLFNNLVPPEFTRSEWEIIGTTKTKDLKKPLLDDDKGHGGLYNIELFMRAFKTPTLRNIALTSPYMHNGAFETLEEVVEFYDRGGGAGLGLDVPNQTLPPDKLNLTKAEKKSLLTFLNTLNDTMNMTAQPVKLPSFPDSMNLNSRVIGGEY